MAVTAEIPSPTQTAGERVGRAGPPRLQAAHYVAAAILALLAALLTSDAWLDLLRYGWKDEESSHVLLVPVAVAWIAFVRRGSLVRCPQVGTWVGALIAAVGLTATTVGYQRDIQIAWHMGAVVFAMGCALSVLGKEVLIRMWPAALVIALMVPVPATGRLLIAQPMQGATATATAEVAQVIGIDVMQVGNTLEINGQNVTVAEACNGMRMVFTLLLVCYVFAFTTPLYNSVRLLILLASPAMAIMANVVRLVPTIWAFGHMSPEASEMFHDIGGWAMLFVSFLALTGIIRLLRWLSIPVAPRGVYAD